MVLRNGVAQRVAQDANGAVAGSRAARRARSHVTTIEFPDPGPYRIISFDVFDTAVLRRVHQPRDLFLLMEDELVAKHGHLFVGFSDRRFEAELETVRRIWKVDRSSEASLDDIYRTLFVSLPHLEPLAEMLRDVELATEAKMTVTSLQTLDYFESVRALGKITIFVSDTYLPHDHVAAVLREAGYHDYDRLFVSSEVGTNKASGRLFDEVLTEMQADPGTVLHLGDNRHSDVAQPRSRGIGAYEVCHPASLLEDTRYDRPDAHRFQTTASESVLRGLQKNYLVNGKVSASGQRSSAYDIGYQILGPVCYGFIDWVIRHAREKEIDRLHFISREGWFLKRVFDEIDATRRTGIASVYLLASRRALFFPLITDPPDQHLPNWFLSQGPTPLAKYLDALELQLDEERLRALGFRGRDELLDARSNKRDKDRFRALLESEAAQVAARAREERALYLEYLHQVGLMSADRVGLVDSGWFGNGQRRLQRFVESCNPEATLHGFYLATHPSATDKFNERSFGYGYLYHFEETGDRDSFNELARTLEAFLSAPFESLKRFAKRDGKLEPVFMNGADVKLDPTVHAIHDGALDFVRDFENVGLTRPELPGPLMANLLQLMLRSPTPAEARCIGSIPYDGPVVAGGRERRFAFPETRLADFLKDPRSLVREFSATSWKRAYYENQESSALRFILRSTQPCLWPRDGYAFRVHAFAQRLATRFSDGVRPVADPKTPT